MNKLFEALDNKIKIRIKLIFLISIGTVILESLSIISVFPIMKTLFQPNFIKENISFIDINFTHNQTIFYLLLLVIFIFIIKNILLFYFSIITSKFINFATVDLTGKYFEKYLSLNYVDFIRYNSSYYVRNVIENISTLFGVYFKCVVTYFCRRLYIA